MASKERVARHAHATRRGLTFVEVLCAAGMLGLAAAAMLSASSAVMSGQARGMQRLGAAEIANRLMLQYLDDEESLPSESAPIQYGLDTYRWTMRIAPLTLTSTVPQDNTRNQGAMSLDRLRAVTITAWRTDEERGYISRDDGTPTFSVTRIVDPIFGQLRNPDTRARIMEDPVLRNRFIEMITGRGQIAPPSRPAGGSKASDQSGGGKK